MVDSIKSNMGSTEAINHRITSFGVFLLGIDQRMANALEFFFRNKCNNQFHITDSDDAVISIIDIDNSKNMPLWKKHISNYPGRPIILLSLREFDAEGVGIVIRKPVDTNKLLSAIDKMARELGLAGIPEKINPSAPSHNLTDDIILASSDGNKQNEKNIVPGNGSRQQAAAGMVQKESPYLISMAPDIDLNVPAELTKAQYEPMSFLIGHVQNALAIARKEKLPVRMLGVCQDSIIIDPEKNELLAGMNERHLRALSSVPNPAAKFTLGVIGHDELISQSRDDCFCYSLDAILWKMALWAARGRVPAGTSFTHPVMLGSWPNLTRLQVFPHATHIAAFLLRQPRSLLNIVETLNIPQRYVFSFYSAANAIGLAYPVQQKEDVAIQSTPIKQHKERKLLSKILGRLRMLSDL